MIEAAYTVLDELRGGAEHGVKPPQRKSCESLKLIQTGLKGNGCKAKKGKNTQMSAQELRLNGTGSDKSLSVCPI
jgi:hypothetical protein